MLQEAGRKKNTVVLIFLLIQCLHLMYSEEAWVLVSLGTQVQPQYSQSRVASRLSFGFLWLSIYDVHKKWPIFWYPHPQHPQKWAIDLLFKNNSTRKHVTDFNSPPSPPSRSRTFLPCGRHKLMIFKAKSKLRSYSLLQFSCLIFNKSEVPFYSKN